MKIIKESNKTKVSLTKTEWEKIAYDAGWITKVSQQTAYKQYLFPAVANIQEAVISLVTALESIKAQENQLQGTEFNNYLGDWRNSLSIMKDVLSEWGQVLKKAKTQKTQKTQKTAKMPDASENLVWQGVQEKIEFIKNDVLISAADSLYQAMLNLSEAFNMLEGVDSYEQKFQTIYKAYKQLQEYYNTLQNNQMPA